KFFHPSFLLHKASFLLAAVPHYSIDVVDRHDTDAIAQHYATQFLAHERSLISTARSRASVALLIFRCSRTTITFLTPTERTESILLPRFFGYFCQFLWPLHSRNFLGVSHAVL